MATKTTKAPSRGTKTSSKKKSFLSKINFSSRKTQFMATILVIAVAGAGYFTFKSFAATGTQIASYTVANGQLTGDTTDPNSKWSVATDATKNNVQVIQLSGNRAKTRLNSFSTAYLSKARTYQTCAMVRKISGAPIIQVVGPGSSSVPLSHNVSSSSYAEFCNSPKVGEFSVGTPPAVLNIKAGTVVSVSSVYIMDVTPAAPAPAPAPAK